MKTNPSNLEEKVDVLEIKHLEEASESTDEKWKKRAKAVASVLAGNADLCSKTSDLEPIVLYYTNRAAKKMSSKKFGKAMITRDAVTTIPKKASQDLKTAEWLQCKVVDHRDKLLSCGAIIVADLSSDGKVSIAKAYGSSVFSAEAKLVVESVPDYLLALSSKIQAYFLLYDDIWDGSHYRRGQSCRFRLPEADMIAVNDGVIICSHVATYYRVLQIHHRLALLVMSLDNSITGLRSKIPRSEK
ncbi:farnesyl diphosphate synthase [Tanacetum coccineum]